MFKLRQSIARRSNFLSDTRSTKRDLSVVLNDTVHIKARIKCIAVRSQITKKCFIPGAILTFASAFTGLMTNNLGLGIGIGLALESSIIDFGIKSLDKDNRP